MRSLRRQLYLVRELLHLVHGGVSFCYVYAFLGFVVLLHPWIAYLSLHHLQ